MNKQQIVGFVGALVLVGILASPSYAQKAFLNRLKTTYNLSKETNGSCKLCHTYDKAKNESAEKKNINDMGKALQAHPKAKVAMEKGDEHKFTPAELDAIEAAVKDLESADTDGDGATNGEELKLGTFPADKTSTPKKEDLEKLRKETKK